MSTWEMCETKGGCESLERREEVGVGGERETHLDDGHAHLKHLLTCRVELSGFDEGLESSLRVTTLEVEFGEVEVTHL